MAAERHESESMHEFRLEGIGLLLGGGLLLAMLGGSFFLGRWVERGAGPQATPPSSVTGPLSQVMTPEPDAEIGEGTHFDDLLGSEKQLEPTREIPSSRPAIPAAREVPSQPSAGGRYFVQVSALRDRGAAAEVIDMLKAQGYGVRLFSEREGQGMLYKVRVGGYPSEKEARDMAAQLRKAGYAGAWVAVDD